MKRLVVAAVIVGALLVGCPEQGPPKPASVPVGKGSEATGYVIFETLVVKNGTAEEVQGALEAWQRGHTEYRIRCITPVIGGGGESLTAHATDTTIRSLVITAYRDAPVVETGSK